MNSISADKSLGIWATNVLHDALWVPVDVNDKLSTCCISPDGSIIAVSGARTKVKLYQCELDAGEHHHTAGARPVGASADRKWRPNPQKHTGAADNTFKQTWRLYNASRSLALHHLTDLTTPAFATVSALAIDGITQRLVASTDAFSLLIWDLDQAALARYSEHRALPLLVSLACIYLMPLHQSPCCAGRW
jgi:WD40 repeat protein